MVKNSSKYLKITMPLILLLTMIAIFFYYNAQENIKGVYKTRGFQGKVQIAGTGWADKITYRMNKEDEVKHYLIFHIDYQETINNKKRTCKDSTSSPYSRFTLSLHCQPNRKRLRF